MLGRQSFVLFRSMEPPQACNCLASSTLPGQSNQMLRPCPRPRHHHHHHSKIQRHLLPSPTPVFSLDPCSGWAHADRQRCLCSSSCLPVAALRAQNCCRPSLNVVAPCCTPSLPLSSNSSPNPNSPPLNRNPNRNRRRTRTAVVETPPSNRC